MEFFNNVCAQTSKVVTENYSTSFSLGIRALDERFRDAIYSIYGFVRFADEIVDTFYGHDQEALLAEFKEETRKGIQQKIHLNPIINAFQVVVHKYNLRWSSIEAFFNSMEMDLHKQKYNQESFEEYVFGSAEVVGLMCLWVFVEGDDAQYDALEPFAKSLGAAFQKINFLRDMKSDVEDRGRVYFPQVNFSKFSEDDKNRIIEEIEKDFDNALIGIKNLPKGARLGVYLAYIYYRRLFSKIASLPASKMLNERIRVPNNQKAMLFVGSWVREKMNVI